MKLTNFNAYNSIEALDSFKSASEINSYRARRLARYIPVSNFIAKRASEQFDKYSVIEVGSGSSTLLYQLEIMGMLRQGVGVELSKSRFDFAERWKYEEGYDNVKNVNSNFASFEFSQATFDWFIVIDNTFTYLYPEDADYPHILLRQAAGALRSGGRILLDFINYDKRLPNIELQQWNVFPEADPFSHGLYSHKIVDGINTTESIFIRRNGGDESRKIELSKVYSLSGISKLLRACDLHVSEVFASFNEDSYLPETSDRLIVVAEKL
jgi:SAM-dependent methyltransferase